MKGEGLKNASSKARSGHVEKDESVYPKKRVTASEREAFLQLALIYEMLNLRSESISQRLQLVRYASRDMKLIARLSEKLLIELLKTVPPDQKDTMLRSVKSAAYTIGIKTPGGVVERDYDNWGLIVPLSVMNCILEGVHEHCLLCSKNVTEQRQCPLHKALDAIPNDAVNVTGGCKYFGVM